MRSAIKASTFALLSMATLTMQPISAAPVARGSIDAQSWSGTWKLDRAHSQFVGPAITIGRTRNGYHFDFGAVAFDVPDDGKDHVTVPPRSTSIKQTAASQWYRVHKVNGAEVDHSVITVDESKSLMTIDTVALAPDGSKHMATETMRRIEPGKGLAGNWRSDSQGINVSTTIEIDVKKNGSVHWNLPDDKQFFDAVVDGPAVPLAGTGSMAGLTMIVQRDKNGLRWTNFLNGKPWMYGIDTLAPDHHTLQETTWTPSRPADKQVASYRCVQGPCAAGD